MTTHILEEQESLYFLGQGEGSLNATNALIHTFFAVIVVYHFKIFPFTSFSTVLFLEKSLYSLVFSFIWQQLALAASPKPGKWQITTRWSPVSISSSHRKLGGPIKLLKCQRIILKSAIANTLCFCLVRRPSNMLMKSQSCDLNPRKGHPVIPVTI